MQTAYWILKALHVIGFVTWFAGLFYLVRMFVYDMEARDKEQPERDILVKQFNLMQWRVYKIIANPAMMITWTAGLAMIGIGFTKYAPNYLTSEGGTPGWMHLKLTLVVLLTVYHIWCKRTIKKLESGQNSLSAWQFRLANELPTIFLLAIVFIATLGKVGFLSYPILFAALLIFGAFIYYGAVSYRKKRAASEG